MRMEINMKELCKEHSELEEVPFHIILGTYKFANGDRYEGNWDDGRMSGEGKI
jgi:hypothetical protein